MYLLNSLKDRSNVGISFYLQKQAQNRYQRPYHIGSRDRFISWPKPVRLENLHLIANNSRFLLLPWIKAHCLASHLLGRMATILPRDWQAIYHHPIYYLAPLQVGERFAQSIWGLGRVA